MSDIVIRGMEMPSCCYGCPLVYDMGEGNYACSFFNGYTPINERRDDCPLVELPELHGDLIDRDKLAKEFEKYEVEETFVFDLLFDAPTVLEASEEQ